MEYNNGIIYRNESWDFDDDLGGIGTVLFRYMKKHSKKVALIQSETDESQTFESLLERCIKVSLHLNEIGIKKGDRICICAEMTISSYVAILASYFIGAVIYCLEPSLPPSESAIHVNHLPPALFFVTETAENVLSTVLEQTNISSRVIVLNKAFENICETEKKKIQNFVPEYIKDSAETACIFFSSGSTGTPKSVQLNHYYLYCVIPDISKTWSRVGLNLKDLKDPMVFACSNWHWVSSLYMLLLCTSNGATRVLLQNLSGPKIWKIIRKYNITSLSLSPYYCIEFYNSAPANPKTYLKSLKELLYGGSRLAEKYVVLINNLLQPEAYARSSYGLTEAGLLTGFDPFNEKHRQYIQQCPKSVGCPVLGFKYKVVDPDSGKILGSNQVGELMVKPFNKKSLFNGYVGIDCQDLFDADGYFRTEDLLYYDENFCFYVVDRLKARIIYKDWLIYPLVVENVLLQHPQVLNAVLIGIDDPEDEEILMGIVTVKNYYDICNNAAKKVALENEIREFVDDRVEDYQKLRKGVKIVNKIPLTASNKINRPKIKQLVMAGEEF
ncbi:uncharacterized protein LOC126738968 [Anthonomus grandis grandis]|uniref:uncharacterized protein LOC126738968 n=1 Tax=Anthonomus grandis grandis TaxID=2921223 RepID=UPI0021654A81|nr:uncharacterized protein LOC126738968 [Anthonomus grandis grandis]